MKCIAHIWSSADDGSKCFFLCLSPLFSVAGGAPVETFTDKQSLSLRLTEIGCSTDSVVMSIAHLGTRTDDTWSFLEVPENIFEQFGIRLAHA
jgi:hypothetical protein